MVVAVYRYEEASKKQDILLVIIVVSILLGSLCFESMRYLTLNSVGVFPHDIII
jgi:hypothetical protein